MSGIESRLEQWRQELLDLTNKNRLLNFRPSTTRPSSIGLIEPSASAIFETLGEGYPLDIVGAGADECDEAVESSSNAFASNSDEPGEMSTALEEATSVEQRPDERGTRQAIRQGTALSQLPIDRTNRVALRLLAKAKASEQEQGINTLFVVFGLLKWRETERDETWRYSPLVLLPARIEEKIRESIFRVSASGDDAEFNQTLAERLRRDFRLELAIELHDESNLEDVFGAVREAVKPQPGWEVLDQVHIGIFQFHKLRMFTDLGEHKDVAKAHPIIQALALDGVTIGTDDDTFFEDDSLDTKVRPEDSFSVLDADATQLNAIRAAISGANLIVHGPPGTGKSQTIANIIAECISRGKTVLFVSEKAAAIEVVHKRLTERRLGEFCLMLHSHKATKRDVINDLDARLEPAGPPPAPPDESSRLIRLVRLRDELNAYPEALHRSRHILNRSAFWIHGELAKLQAAPFLDAPFAFADGFSVEKLDDWAQLVDQTTRHAAVLREGASHVWAAVNVDDLSLAERSLFREDLVWVRSAIEEISKSATLLANHFGLSEPRTLLEARRIEALAASIPLEGVLQPQWFDARRADEAAALVAALSARMASAAQTKRQLLVTHEESIFEIDVDGAIASYESGAISRLFSSRYRKYRSEIKGCAGDKGSRSREQELALLRQVEAIKLHESWFESERGSFAAVLIATPDVAQAFNPGIFENAQIGLDTAKRIRDQFDAVDLPAEFIEALCRPNPGRSVSGIRAKLATTLDGVDQRLDRIAAIVDLSISLDGQSPDASDAQELAQSFDNFISRIGALDEWLQAKRAMRRIEQAGIAGIVNSLISNDIPTDEWTDALRRLVLTHALDAVQREDKTLQVFNGAQHDDVVSRFRAADVAYIDASAARLKRSLAHRQGRISTAHGGEPVFLRAQKAKRRGQAPLRKVFERIPNLLPALKPCLMMSPLSVAHFLPANLYKFDVVIFDEASQVRPYDAVGAIMRGKQLIVAGDEHQLPPTSFFDREIDDLGEESDDDIAGVESILKALRVKGMRSAYLYWHYRSQHEDLIAFSNRYFYEGRLITFPSAITGPSPTRGVQLVHVQDGRYEEERDKVLKTPQRVNRIEAKRLAQLVIRHARTRPNESLGVVALSINQRDVVEEEIKSARLLDQSLDDFFRPDREEPFFVKALEQVQGDERDVIIVTIGYSKSASGTLIHNFGPINRDGGERRLNVLVTRAKHQIIVVSSIRAGDMDLNRTHKERKGSRLLKNYLDFAERGPVAFEAETTGGDGAYESPFEAEVGEALARAGYDVRRQVGTSGYRIDLAIVDPEQPGRYLLGIECDGATYHSSKTARDRDRLRQAILENLGWRMHRVWSTEWIRDPQLELTRAIEQIERAKASRGEPDAPFVSVRLIDDESSNLGTVQPVAPTDEAAALMADDYFIADLSRFVVADLLQTPLRLLADAVVHCVTIEGPIHVELLTKRMTAEWGLQRAGVRIANMIEQAISAAMAQGRIDRSGAFLRIPGTVVLGIRGEDEYGSLRAVGHLPPEEIEKAFELILDHAFSLSEDELVLQTARLFGFKRTGAEIDRRFRGSIRSAIQRQCLEVRNERIQMPQD